MTPDRIRQSVIVRISPEDTIEPMVFLSFLPLKYETFLDKTTGIPLDAIVINTANMLKDT